MKRQLYFLPLGISALFQKHPKVLLLTTEVHEDVPVHFGGKYFGTD